MSEERAQYGEAGEAAGNKLLRATLEQVSREIAIRAAMAEARERRGRSRAILVDDDPLAIEYQRLNAALQPLEKARVEMMRALGARRWEGFSLAVFPHAVQMYGSACSLCGAPADHPAHRTAAPKGVAS